jgi:hypothetical protein
VRKLTVFPGQETEKGRAAPGCDGAKSENSEVAKEEEGREEKGAEKENVVEEDGVPKEDEGCEWPGDREQVVGKRKSVQTRIVEGGVKNVTRIVKERVRSPVQHVGVKERIPLIDSDGCARGPQERPREDGGQEKEGECRKDRASRRRTALHHATVAPPSSGANWYVVPCRCS